MLVSCLAYSSTLKMEITYSSETSISFQRTVRRYIQEDRNIYNHRCENLKSYIAYLYEGTNFIITVLRKSTP
jgi:hypothetical protein